MYINIYVCIYKIHIYIYIYTIYTHMVIVKTNVNFTLHKSQEMFEHRVRSTTGSEQGRPWSPRTAAAP